MRQNVLSLVSFYPFPSAVGTVKSLNRAYPDSLFLAAKKKLEFGDTSPKRIRWLTDQEAINLKLNANGIGRMIVHCELDLDTRRIELLRLKVQDFQSGRVKSILVRDKGRNGGKYWTTNWHSLTAGVLEEYLSLRDREILEATGKSQNVMVPDSLSIYERSGRLCPYQKTGVDGFLKDLGSRMGIDFSNHDLRRTCGRMMYRAGVPLELIARIFGHSDTRTTSRYLGLDYEDMSSAMTLYAQYQKNVICPKTGTFGLSQESGGPSGI